jgi:hypothetical protein
MLFKTSEIGDDLLHGIAVVLFLGERKQLVGVIEARRQFVQTVDDLFQLSSLLPQSLCPFRFVPDVRLLQLSLDFCQPFRLGFIVKDTSSTHQRVQLGRLLSV